LKVFQQFNKWKTSLLQYLGGFCYKYIHLIQQCFQQSVEREVESFFKLQRPFNA